MANEHISIENLTEYNNNLLRDANILKRNTNYILDSVVNKGQVYLKCTQAGKTDTATLVLTSVSVDDILDDGTAKWKVLSVNGIPENSEAQMKEWESNTSYTVGENLVYDGTVYKVTTDFTSGETFDDTNLEEYIAQKMKGATNSQDGASGLVPQPTTSDITKFLCGDGTWKSVGGSGAGVIKDTLWNGFETSATTLNLTHDYSEYDYIAVSVGEGRTHSVFLLSTATGSRLDISSYYPTAEQYSYASRITFSGATAQLDSVIAQSSGYGIFRIEGIKFVNPNVYSTEEQRIGTWIDGKPLYQKTFTGTSPSSANTNVAVITMDASTDIHDIDGYVFNANNTYIPLNFYYSSSAYVATFYYMTNGTLLMRQSGYENQPFYITIKYTKTTD